MSGSGARQIDVGGLVDGQRIRGVNLAVLLLCLLATIIDGYDIFVPGVIAPELIRTWHFPPAQLGGMFSLGMVGIILGAALFGYLGDRFGRKRAIVLASLLYGALTLVSLAADNLTEFTILRFLIGLGIGGAIPNAIALVAEFTPRRARTSFLLLVMVGAPIGQLLPALVSVTLVPSQGWHVLLVVGGVGPLLIAALAQWALPESVKFLTIHAHRRGELLALARRMRPDLALPEGTVFVIAEPPSRPGWSPASLFAEGLAPLTSLVWLCLGSGLLGIYFVASWLPAALQAAGATPQEAAGRLAFFALGGIAGGLLMTQLMRRFGVLAIVGVFLVSVPLVACIGLSGLDTATVSALTAAAGFCVIAIINGVEAVMGLIYPTAIRAKGAGWGLAVGRLGAVIGPLIGGMLVSRHLSNFALFMAPSICLAVGTLASAVLAMLLMRRYGSIHVDAEAPVEGMAPMVVATSG
jgi:AAHS family 4-hydroxybenzoate transporter-like MFS transporter